MKAKIIARAFAPVNIAWIKYMGKTNGLPTNTSLSMTLDLGTTTEIRVDPAQQRSMLWNERGYIPPQKGQEKVEKFLLNFELWTQLFDALKIESPLLRERKENFRIEIFSQNSIPASTGIASSASAFAALTLAWAGVLAGDRREELENKFKTDPEARKIFATTASFGSGSASRSIGGPWVEWHPKFGTQEMSFERSSFCDFILILEKNEKLVSSSDAHQRVLTSPNFDGRAERAEQRLSAVKNALNDKQLATLQAVVLEEALDMHTLFRTANPPFDYQNAETRSWILRARSCNSKNRETLFPSQNAILTLDAGANVHWFVPIEEKENWRQYFSDHHPHLEYLLAHEGRGAQYEEC